MPAYVIARLTVTDPEAYQRYVLRFREVTTPFGGRVLAATEAPEILEGVEPANRVVLLGFPTIEAAREWYYSPAYQEVAVERLAAAHGDVVLIEGPPTSWADTGGLQ